MKVYARFYVKGIRKYYKGTVECDCIDDGIAKVKDGIAKKFDLHKPDMINTTYEVVRD